MSIICAFIFVYIFVLIVRAVLTWFPIRPGTPVASVAVLLRDVTEPVLAPVRRIIPPISNIDISSLIVVIALIVVQRILC
ncbi:MAG: YggT family protein [Acidimicrobiia bacterium]